MEAIANSQNKSYWKEELPDFSRKQIVSSVFAFLMLTTMMAQGTDVINNAVREERKRLEARQITGDYSQQLVLQNEQIQKFAITSDVKSRMQDDLSAVHDLFLEVDDDLSSRQCILPVKTIYQKPELPNGCEITSATIVLNYLGFNVSKVTMADTYLPKQYPYYSVDPNVAYMGNPHTGQGWYCLPGPIVTAVNSYLSSVGDTKYVATDITGVSIDELKEYIKNDHPIVFWATVGFSSPRKSHSFTLPNGEYPYTGLHCLVLKGYDEDSMYIADPLGITSTVSIDRFASVFQGMGSRAVLIAERGLL